MRDESIKTSLIKLKESINSADGIDEETLALAQSLEVDIQKLLDKDGGINTIASPVDTAMALETKFEAEHPTAASILREMISTLQKMGI